MKDKSKTCGQEQLGALNLLMNSYMTSYVTKTTLKNSQSELEINVRIHMIMNSENIEYLYHEFIIGIRNAY